MKNTVIKDEFVELLRNVKVGNVKYLKQIVPYEREPQRLPALHYVYRGHTQGEFSTLGMLDLSLGRETGIARFTYNWLWELFVPINAGENTALREFEEFDVNMGVALYRDSRLGGFAESVSITPRTDPSLGSERDARYMYMQYDFSAVAEEEV